MLLIPARLGGVPTIRSPCIPPDEDRGVDTDGDLVMKERRRYRPMRPKDDAGDRALDIEFRDRGVQAGAFTFGQAAHSAAVRSTRRQA